MKLEDCPPNARPNLHHEHPDLATEDGPFVGEHTHDIVDHLGRTLDGIVHHHDPDGNLTVGEFRHKPPR